MLREYTVFNVAQCEGLPNRILTPQAKAPRGYDFQEGQPFKSAIFHRHTYWPVGPLTGSPAKEQMYVAQ